ncbi:MAG TPA: S41 family peptidase [Chloroflexota bacterium]|nr:S41 family peptidase [Chloroflexota bacterium]
MAKSLLLGIVIGLSAAALFVGGFVTGTTFDRSQSVSTSDHSLQDFLSAYRLVTKNYYGHVSRRQLIYAAIDGMMAATGDPHTIFLSPSENVAAGTQLNGTQYGGIGAIVEPEGKYLRVVVPLPHSPALAAGLRSGDRVIAIDGHSVTSSSQSPIDSIHGRPGTTVRLTVRRGTEDKLIVVRRAVIPPVTAYARTLRHGIGYIQIFSFGDSTPTEVANALRSLHGDRKLILDLRDNPGGYVTAAQSVVSDFLPRGVVAYERSKNGAVQTLPVLPGQVLTRARVAVLVNGGTASAAEITAAALRDEDRATLIGTRTYGKGSMQSVYSLGDGASVRVTDRLWLTPRRKSIQGTGLRPTIAVAAPATGTTDPALARAIHFLESQP